MTKSRPRCHGTVEDHRRVALDVRELVRKKVSNCELDTFGPEKCFNFNTIQPRR